MLRTPGSRSSPLLPSPSRRDRRSGLVRTVPACERCRHFKKKCSRTLPACSSCTRTSHECSLSAPADSTSADNNSLRARVEWLSHYINRHVAVDIEAPAIESIDTGADLEAIINRASAGRAAIVGPTAVAGPSPRTTTDEELSHDQRNPRLLRQGNRAEPRDLSAFNAPSFTSEDGSVHMQSAFAFRPENIASAPSPCPRTMAGAFVDAYFSNVNKAYPFINRLGILRDLDKFCGSTAQGYEQCSTHLRLVMAIGSTTLQRANRISAEMVPRFGVEYLNIIASCLAKPSMDSVRTLMLLALYSLFDPFALSVWSIVGFAAKQATTLGITRQSQRRSTVDAEQSHRLYWSLFTLDRMISFSLGLPISLVDENTDIPLPSFTIEEFTSTERSQFASSLQTHRHVIHLRKIEGRILEQIHQRKASEITLLSQADRKVMLQDIRSEIELWYSSGSMLSSQAADDLGIHTSISWLCARYYQLMLMLHYPCHFNSFEQGFSAFDVVNFAQKHLQSTYTMAQNHQLPLNFPTICRLLPVTLFLMHHFATVIADGLPFPAKQEVGFLIEIVDAYPKQWTQASKTSKILHEFQDALSSYDPAVMLHTFGNGQTCISEDPHSALARLLIDDFVSLMKNEFGIATCYVFESLPKWMSSQQITMPVLQSGLSHPEPIGPPLAPLTGLTSFREDPDVPSWESWGLNFL